jgi:transposase
MATSSKRRRRLWDAYAFAMFRQRSTVRGVFGDPKARVITLERRSKKTTCGCCGRTQSGWYVIDRHWDGIAAYCKPENKGSLGFVEGLNNKIRVIQRRAYGLRDEEYLRLKILTCMLPEF